MWTNCAASDIYAAGATLYHLLSGQLPFDYSNEQRLLGRILDASATLMSEVRPDIPAGLLAVVERAMRRDPVDRFPTAADMLAAIDPYLRSNEKS